MTPTTATASYYDEMQRFYSLFWHRDAVHYGCWEEGVTTHDAAVRHMDDRVAAALSLGPGSRVVDAGCGVGGTAMHLSTAHGLSITGLTLSEDQRVRAERGARTLDPSRRPRFLRRSYMDTGFKAASVDGMYGIESICYAEPLAVFLKECHRILVPGGRLVVADGFDGQTASARDAADLRVFCDGFALASLYSQAELVEKAEQAGFRCVAVEDLTPRVLPSARRIERLSRVGRGLLWAASRIGKQKEVWGQHVAAGLVQRGLLARRAMVYAIVVLEKG